MEIESVYHGLCSYMSGLELQDRTLERIKTESIDGVVLGFEHEPVVTLGVRGDAAVDLSSPWSGSEASGIPVVETKRGGQATLHSPGQLVIYPCLNLRKLGWSPREFVQQMEAVTAKTLTVFGVEAVTKSCREPGLFVDSAKIAAFGFRIQKGLTSHGIAINVSNDLSLFDHIRTCGVERQALAKIGDKASLTQVFEEWFNQLKAIVDHPTPAVCPGGSQIVRESLS